MEWRRTDLVVQRRLLWLYEGLIMFTYFIVAMTYFKWITEPYMYLITSDVLSFMGMLTILGVEMCRLSKATTAIRA
jgi:hypothetical protein